MYVLVSLFSLLTIAYYYRKGILTYLFLRALEEKTETSNAVLITDKVLKITYNRYGQTHSVYIPYNRNLVSEMIDTKCYAIRNNEKIDITQQPGVNYFINRNMLECDKIILVKDDVEQEIA